MLAEIKSLLSKTLFESQRHLCDLIDFEYPVLAVYAVGPQFWIHLWCDRTAEGINRWLVFAVSIDGLRAYLAQQLPLLALVKSAESRYFVDSASWLLGTSSAATIGPAILDQLQEYLPAADSFFDASLTQDTEAVARLLVELKA